MDREATEIKGVFPYLVKTAVFGVFHAIMLCGIAWRQPPWQPTKGENTTRWLVSDLVIWDLPTWVAGLGVSLLLIFGIVLLVLLVLNRKLKEKVESRTQLLQEKTFEHEHAMLTILDSIDADVYVADFETYEILFMNQHMRSSFGENLAGQVCWKVFRGEKAPCPHCTNDQLLDESGEPAGVIVWDGQNPITGGWYTNRDRAIRWVDGRIVHLQIAIDISERVQMEDELRMANRALRMLSDWHLAMIRAASEDALFTEICQNAIRFGGYRLAWVGLARSDEAKTVRPVAQAGFNDGYLETVKLTWADTERGQGPTGTAIRTGEVVISRDILSDPKFAPWREQAIRRGYAASIALPIILPNHPSPVPGDGIVGTINIYAEKPDAFGRDEVELLKELTNDLAYGLETRRIQNTLQSSEAKMRSVFRAAPIGIGLVVNRSILDVNDRFCEITGYSHSELIGQNARLVYPSDMEYENVGEVKYKQILDRGTGSVETRFKRKDGRIIEVLLSSTPLDPDNLDAGVTFTVLDITERKRGEEALRSSEERFRTAFRTSPDSININRLEDGMYVDINDGFTAITGYTRKDVIGKSSLEINIWENPIDRQKLVEGLKQSGRVNNLEARFRMKDGRVLTGLMSAQVIDLHGEPHILSVTRDIEELKDAEAALRRSEALLTIAQELSHTGGWEWDVRKEEMYWTDEVYLIHGLSPEDIPSGSSNHIQRSIECYDLDSQPQIQAAFQNCVEQGDPYDLECPFTDYQGRQKWIRTMAKAVWEQGEIVRVVGNIMDITERKMVESEINQSRQQLRALTDYLQTAIETERAHISREIHDEFGQLLTGLKMDLAFLVRTLKPDSDQLLRTQAMDELIDQAIRITRRLSSELRPGILDDLGLWPALEWLSSEFDLRHNLSCTISLPPDEPTFDPELNTTLFRIYQESLTNIVRHANATWVKAKLVLNENQLCFEIKDNGRGITQEELRHTKSLGLLGMKERAAIWGGTVTFVGEPGVGTTVLVRIPLPENRVRT